MTMTLGHGHGHEQAPPRSGADGLSRLRRMADLETVIKRQSAARSNLSARGLATPELDRIIDVLVGSLQLLQGYHAAIEDAETGGKPIASLEEGS